jgi:UDP-N-acetyl-D-galactosamine dehydrogenase
MNIECIGVIGLGYVGLPLACLFAGKYRVVGYDINSSRISEINHRRDSSGMMQKNKLDEAFANGMVCTSDKEQLKQCNVYVISVPTPVDNSHRPDTKCLEEASSLVGEVIGRENVVVYESTVYPGLTEELCLPIIERRSGLKLNVDFYGGYSPERINPVDKEHTVENILKITSGTTPEIAEFINQMYASVLKYGTYKAASIKIAEAAKIMENTQRDVNIAFMNEMTILLDKLGLNPTEVIKAASTKWNFLPFQPGLVGGHCISVDPYYLISLAEKHGFTPNVMKSARAVNEYMGTYMADRVVDKMSRRGINPKDANVLVMGFSFKENCPDTRNTKVALVYQELKKYVGNVTVYDPWVSKMEAQNAFKISVETEFENIKGNKYDAILLCVKHDCFKAIELESLENPDCVVYDLKESVTPSTTSKAKQTELECACTANNA